MDDAATFTSDTASMKRRILLEQLMTIRSLMRKEGAADDDDSRDRDVVINYMKKGMTLNKEQLTTALSTEFLLTVLLDLFLLRLLDDGEREEGGATEPSATVSSAQQQLMDDAAAAKKKKRAAAKKNRYKRNKAAAKHKKTKLMSWLSGGIISAIMMVAFSFITTPIVTLSLFQPSDGSGEGKARPALPPAISKFLRQEDLNSDNEASTSPDTIRSPSAAVVLPPVFAPTAVSKRRMTSDEISPEPSNSPSISANSPSSPAITNPPTAANPSSSSSSTRSDKRALPLQCFDTPSWKDKYGNGCDFYEAFYDRGCPSTDNFAGYIGPATGHCCYCFPLVPTPPPTSLLVPPPTLTPTPIPTWLGTSGFPPPTSTPTSSFKPSYSSPPTPIPTLPLKSDAPSSPPSSSPTQFCMDTPNWESVYGKGCDFYQKGCPEFGGNAFGEIGVASEHCCHCGGGSRTCEDFRSKCQDYFNVVGIKDGALSPLCKEAESCSCEATDHAVKIDTYFVFSQTVGLYNECKCNFWTPLCEDKGVGEACDYAAEYCCGDYKYDEDTGFLSIEEFPNPCGHTQDLRTYFLDGVDNSLDERSVIERPSLEAIYNETDGQNWTNSAGWMNETEDYCVWHGISCDSDGFVTSIDLRDNNLAGQFPVYTNTNNTRSEGNNTWLFAKYGLGNLYNLKMVDLADNKLIGTIDYRSLYNLNALFHFDVSGNQLSGEVEVLVTPSLTHADFSSNRFTSMRQLGKLKQSFETLRFCDVSNNFIQNDVNDFLQSIPPNIERFFASNNQIIGSLPNSCNNLPELRQFNLSSNDLSGNLPDFAGSVINLADNKLTGTISPDIGKMTALEEFDLSNNSLINAIPSELGKLDGSLQLLSLLNNALSGVIPSQLGQLQGASIFLTDNRFDNSSNAPLSLCTLRSIKEFDLANDTELCPAERNALSVFYDSTKGAEWTNDINWLDEYESYCDWNGVTCDEGENHVIKLELDNNGLSGRLSESIGKFTFIEKLDLSDNDIKVISMCCDIICLYCYCLPFIADLTKQQRPSRTQLNSQGSIPTEIGLLSELTYLRLSYNAFTGTAPRVLGELANLQLLQLQSNRITELPTMTQFDKNAHDKSAFVTDCGVPSAFEEAPECQNCNANDDCYPQEDIPITKYVGLDYATFAAVFFAFFVVLCCLVALSLYLFDNRKNHRNSSFNALSRSVESERRIGEEDDNYALSRIGKESVYSYFVTDKPVGWLIAFATLGIQTLILVFFIMASEANLQDDDIDIEFTWKCPRDSDRCDDKADWTKVSTVYNRAIATSNTDIIVNSVVVLFIMDLDEWIFFSLDAINEKWTEHAADADVSEMREEIARQRAQLASQQKEIDDLRDDLRKLCETVELQIEWPRW
eukprot:scaffold1955_cov106-Skeletonema_dohrnii-CCMP3373.AAC.13